MSIAFDRVLGEAALAGSTVSGTPPVPTAETYRPVINVGALDGESNARLQRWRAEIDDHIAGLRVHDLRRREEIIRVAFEERYLTDRERVLREHAVFADDLLAKTDAAAYERLQVYADEVAQNLARLATLGLYPRPPEAAMADEPGLDGLERTRRAEGRTRWSHCQAARDRYEADIRQLLAETADQIEVHLRDMLEELDRTRQQWESETPLSRPAPVAGMVQEEGELRDVKGPAELPPGVKATPPGLALRRPDLRRREPASPWPDRESLLTEARVFAAQRGYTLASPRDPGRDVTAEFVAWRNGYRSTR